jgi:hypothetical protein
MLYNSPAQDRGQWLALVNTSMNFRVPYNVGKFLGSWATGGFSRTQLDGVGQLYDVMLHVVTCMSDYRLRFRVDIGFTVTTYTHNSKLQAITALSLISTLYKPPQNTLSLFQPAVSSPAVPWQRLLAVEILELPHSSPLFTASRTELSRLPQLSSFLGMDRVDDIVHFRIRCRGNVFTEPFPRSRRIFLLIKNLLPSNKRRTVVFRSRCLEKNVVSEPFTSNGCFSDSTVLALSKYVTILTDPFSWVTVTWSCGSNKKLMHLNSSILVPGLFCILMLCIYTHNKVGDSLGSCRAPELVCILSDERSFIRLFTAVPSPHRLWIIANKCCCYSFFCEASHDPHLFTRSNAFLLVHKA